MILDTSPIIAIIFKKTGHKTLMEKISDAVEVGIGVPTLVECDIVLSARLNQDARGLLGCFLYEPIL